MLLRSLALGALLVQLHPALFPAEPSNGLRGISVVDVAVERLSSDAERFGLTADELKQDIQLKLRQNGIKVSDVVAPFFYLVAHCVYIPELERFAYTVNAQFVQEVLLPRQPGLRLMGTTWHDGSTGHISQLGLRSSIRKATSDVVDRFLNAYLAENPK